MKLDINDIKGLLETFEDLYLESIRDKKQIDSKELQQNVERLLYDVYELNGKMDNIAISCKYYLELLLPDLIDDFLKDIHLKYKSYEKVKDTFMKLKELKLPEQRSQEWYDLRETVLTASSLADALGKGHFQTRDELLFNNTTNIPPLVSDVTIFTPIGDGVKLKSDIDSHRHASVDGSYNTPKNMFMFTHNQCKPECCPSPYTCSNGCICVTKNQKNFIKGANKESLGIGQAQFFIYDTSDGEIRFDADGNGGQGATLVAEVSNVPGGFNNFDFGDIAVTV